MEIKTLDKVAEVRIYEAFKLAFENYVIPITFDEEQTLRRWKTAGVSFEISYGAFDQGELVGIILQTQGSPETLFNFTTGVIPSHRGRGLVKRIYEKIWLDHPDVTRYRLEVITENITALSLYKKLGFRLDRELHSYKGPLELPSRLSQKIYDVRPLSYPGELESIRLHRPASEDAPPSLLGFPHLHELHTLREGDELRAYAIFTPSQNAIREVGTLHEEQLDELFLRMKLQGESLRFMNIDATSSLNTYLAKRKLNRIVSQYEMELLL